MRGLSFSKWLLVDELFAEATATQKKRDFLSVDQASLPDVRSEVQKYWDLGATYNGETYPNGGEYVELAAAAQGRKPVALVQMRASGGHPALMSRRNPQNDKVVDYHNAGLIQKMLIQKALQHNEDFTVLPLKGMSHGWLVAGEERAAREMERLYALQHELTLRSAHKGFANPGDRDKIRQALSKPYNATKQLACQEGDAGFTCQILHRHIGQLLGYDNKSIEDFVGTLPDQLPSHDTEFVSELPHSFRGAGNKLRKDLPSSGTPLSHLD